jgi:uncharacterized protein involved in outer membrane biogenesis
MMQKTLGEMNGDVQLRGSGNSVALLGNSNGNEAADERRSD